MRSKLKFTRIGFNLKKIRISKRAQFFHKCKNIFLNNQKEILKCNRNFCQNDHTNFLKRKLRENQLFWFESWILAVFSLIFCSAVIGRFHVPAHLLTQRIWSSLIIYNYIFNEETFKNMVNRDTTYVIEPKKYKRKWKI